MRRCAIRHHAAAELPGSVARAEIFDESALDNPLISRRLGGTALDIWHKYPTVPGPTAPANVPFHQLDNGVMTPPVSGWTEGVFDARVKVVADNIERIAHGEEPMNGIAAHA